MDLKQTGKRTMLNDADLGQSFAVKLMQHLVVPTFVLDAEGTVLIWNKACERLTGVPAVDVIGTREHWRAFYDEPRPCLADLLAQGRLSEVDALYVAHDDPSAPSFGVRAENWCLMPRRGTELYLAIDAGPIYDEEGGLLAVVETLRDMTDHKRAQVALEQLATRDALTDIANRRSFDQRLGTEWKRECRDLRALSLLMIDIDHFKRYNDTYGHPTGDQCLKQIAKALEQAVYRPGDLVARYGGEEFAVILTATDADGARVVAERMLERVAALTIPHAGDESGRVTLSIGIATAIPHPDVAPDSLIAAADAALYRAKHAGRNRYVTDLAAALVP